MDKNTALLIVDEQNDYFSGGKFELHNSEAALNNTLRVLERFRENKNLVIHIRHEFPKGGPFFEVGSDGAKIHPAIIPANEEPVVTKNEVNSFSKTNLLDILKKNGINKLVITGMMSHMCVDSVTRAAKDLGFDNTVIEDCCATRDLQFGNRIVKADDVHAAYMAALAFAFAKVTNTNDFLKQIEK